MDRASYETRVQNPVSIFFMFELYFFIWNSIMFSLTTDLEHPLMDEGTTYLFLIYFICKQYQHAYVYNVLVCNMYWALQVVSLQPNEK